MDSLITAAARALAAGDPLGALKRVGLRDDAPALALRGITMAQLGDFARAKMLLKNAARAFGPKEAVARARCVVAEAEIALVSRDLRYWNARRENAELSVPEPNSGVVRFGMTVSLEGEDGAAVSWHIVGEDEADPAKGSISHVSPVARALFGKAVGDTIAVNGREWEVVGLG